MRRIVLALLSAAAGCTPAVAPTDFAHRIGVLGPIEATGPRAPAGASAVAGDLVFEPLASPRPGGWSSPILRGWERTAARRWTVELLPDVHFSDGARVSPADVASALTSEGLRAHEVGPALVVEDPSGRPLEIVLATTVLSRRTPSGPVGTGAFAVESHSAERLVLRRVEPAPGGVARVEMVACKDAREAFARLLRGEVNAMLPIDRAFAELLDGVPGVRVLRGASPSAVVVRFGPGLSAVERRALAAAMPVAEISAAVKRETCCAEPPPPRPPFPPGRPLSIAYPGNVAGLARAALSLRQALGPRGGEIEAVMGAESFLRRAREFDLQLMTMLVRPPGVGALYFKADGPYNWSGYRNAAYDAALAAGDEGAAAEALRGDPPAVVILRLERMAAVDARLADATLGEWGTLDTLRDWKVAR